ncbi:MAG: helix-turn-helix transcriptional regulator [Clostridia bacterium]|nr:helix-turn-helix transcriptional regulator [Clostridia bacterium]
MARQLKFSENLKNLRLGNNKFSKKFTQLQIAEQTGIARSMISDYEHGIKEPTLSAVAKLAKFFDLTLDELCYGRK